MTPLILQDFSTWLDGHTTRGLIEPTTVAADLAGNTFPNGPNRYLWIQNTAGIWVSAQITVDGGCDFGVLHATGAVFTLAVDPAIITGAPFGPFRHDRFSADGLVKVKALAAGLQLAAIQL